jgi:hypothetical protein
MKLESTYIKKFEVSYIFVNKYKPEMECRIPVRITTGIATCLKTRCSQKNTPTHPPNNRASVRLPPAAPAFGCRCTKWVTKKVAHEVTQNVVAFKTIIHAPGRYLTISTQQ